MKMEVKKNKKGKWKIMKMIKEWKKTQRMKTRKNEREV